MCATKKSFLISGGEKKYQGRKNYWKIALHAYMEN